MNENSLLDAQEDLFQRTLADDWLADVAVLNEYDGDISTEVINSLTILNKRASGKVGACIICQHPMASEGDAAVAGGILEIEHSFLVLEDPTFNKGAAGTQKRGLAIARRLFGLHYLYHPVGLGAVLRGRPPKAIVPIPVKDVPVAFEVAFVSAEEEFYNDAKVMTPTITPRNGAAPQVVTLGCGTAGAEIYYTLDGTYPRAGNAGAILYAGVPVNVLAAATLRAGAFKAGFIASDINAANYT